MANINANNARPRCARERVIAAKKNRLFRKSQSAIFILNLACLCLSQLEHNLILVKAFLTMSFLLSVILFVREFKFAKENPY